MTVLAPVATSDGYQVPESHCNGDFAIRAYSDFPRHPLLSNVYVIEITTPRARAALNAYQEGDYRFGSIERWSSQSTHF